MKPYCWLLICLFGLAGVPQFSWAQETAEPIFPRSLFDGKTLKGWKVLPGGSWKVEQGMIVGKSPKSETRHGMLISEETFDNFELKLKFLVLEGNSGVYFRCEQSDDAYSVHGFQAEVENSALVGGLYETGGRGWVSKPDPKLTNHVYKAALWNDLVIKAVGKEITVHLNGHQVTHLKDDPGRLSGHIALQLHGKQEMDVLFKDIEIKVLPAPE